MRKRRITDLAHCLEDSIVKPEYRGEYSKKRCESFSIEEGIEWMKTHPMRELTLTADPLQRMPYLEYRWNKRKNCLEYQSSMSGKWFKSTGVKPGRFIKDWYADIGIYS